MLRLHKRQTLCGLCVWNEARPVISAGRKLERTSNGAPRRMTLTYRTAVSLLFCISTKPGLSAYFAFLFLLSIAQRICCAPGVHRVFAYLFLHHLLQDSITAMTAQSVKTLFECHPTLSKLYEGIAQTKALEQDLAALLPAYLMPYIAVGLIRQAKLTLFVAQGAQAAKLRHLAPSVLEALHRRGWSVDSLRVRVRLPTIEEGAALGNVFYSGDAQQPVHKKKACLSQCAWASLQQLNTQLDTSPLKHALSAMVERHRTASPSVLKAIQS